MTSILKFRIFSITSQDYEYPAQDLVSLGRLFSLQLLVKLVIFSIKSKCVLHCGDYSFQYEIKWMAITTLLHLPAGISVTI